MISKVQNLVLNMSSGLLPKDLTKDEVDLLVEEYGEEWFEELGFSEDKYEKPNFKKE